MQLSPTLRSALLASWLLPASGAFAEIADDLRARDSVGARADVAVQGHANGGDDVDLGASERRERFAAAKKRSDGGSREATLWCIQNFPVRDGGPVNPANPVNPVNPVNPTGELAIEARTALQALHLRWIELHADAPAAERDAFLVRLRTRSAELLGRERADELYLELDRRATDDELRARILLARARLRDARRVQDMRRRAEARELYAALRLHYASSAAARAAREDQWYLENLSVGAKVPDFVTHDGAGNEIRLSDYRGQVVVVRFWNSFSDADEARLEHEQQLVERLWDERFSMIGVHVGTPRGLLRRGLQRRQVTWTQAAEPAGGGAAARGWRIRHYPSTFVIAADGVLRGLDLEGRALDALADGLLAELRNQTAEREAQLAAMPPGGSQDALRQRNRDREKH
ncbi:MAG: TlpA family protein disulfide reductase [bacterium]|nr:TlpA family protein disulfide reductase [bacterium]